VEFPSPSPVVGAFRALALFVLAFLAAPALAGGPEAQARSPQDAVLQVLRAELARTAPGMRQDIALGSIDNRLALAPCETFEAALPPGISVRGRVLVPVHCRQGASWTAMVAATVRLFAPALVTSRPIAAFGLLRVEDLHTEEVEWTKEASGFAVTAAQLEDRLSTANIDPGHAIPLRTLRPVPSFAQGETVKILWLGEGFQVSAQAVALSAAAPGESVRVRTESGGTLTGTARKGRIVEVAY